MNIEDVKKKLETAFPDLKLKLVRETLLVENPQDLPKLASFLKEDPELRLDYLSSVTGADYLTYLETVYHFYSTEKKTGPWVLRVRTDRQNPRIPSLVPIFRSAEFQEREAYDLYGVIYENHPDLRRVFMWEGFSGFPLRKDYVQEDSEILEEEDIAWLEQRGVGISDEMKKQAEEYKKQGPRLERKEEA